MVVGGGHTFASPTGGFTGETGEVLLGGNEGAMTRGRAKRKREEEVRRRQKEKKEKDDEEGWFWERDASGGG